MSKRCIVEKERLWIIANLRRFVSETSKLKKSWKLFKFNGMCEMNILLKFGSDLQSSIRENQYQKWDLIHGFLWEYLGETQNT